ncbi:Hypothetical protein RG1141_CH35840 [Neorhizobium galegae bv. officinalis bv. officinalis str. HAMBI 1141]|uniref:Lytic murein transglycosylase n=1 Tax=Neorhizobium galegae bv. officinalis bv. officinalis str. HAMBI 1141 TaxID=1028801 RepID=A0A068TBP4_NEOGA|nr:Hypothetical protein RG1141_CH35840 [Neorhizobium galegae bv. officinalis bv. officinalis str. HAMBI 1141]
MIALRASAPAELRSTPLCPAGHLPLKGGDRLGACSPLTISRLIFRDAFSEAKVVPLVISPLEGEMAGRPEGGNLARRASRNFTSIQETHDVPRS